MPPIRRLGGGKRRGAAIPMAVLALKGEQPCAPTFARDARTLGRDILLRCIGEVAKHLPANRRVGIQQPGDVVHHQPHPPGYLVYVATGRLLLPIFGDANTALIALSIFGECAGVVIAYLFAREVFGEWAGLVASLALAVAPLFWYYGEAANTYALEPAAVMFVAWPCWRLWQRDAGAALPAGLALGLAGALRPSSAFFLLPLVCVALWRAVPVRAAVTSLGAAAALTMAWVVPLICIPWGLLAVGPRMASPLSTLFW